MSGGGAGGGEAGLPPHAHGASQLLLLAGAKEWALWPSDACLPEPARRALPPPLLRTNARCDPPGVGCMGRAGHLSPCMHACRGPSAVFEQLRALQGGAGGPLLCAQGPGDVVLLPPGAHHATRNAGATLAVGAAWVRSHRRFRSRGVKSVSASGIKWTNGSAKRQCDRALR